MTAARSVEAPSHAQLPHECGWMLVTDLMSTQPLNAPLLPRSGRCSVQLCSSSTGAAAIRRAPTSRKPGCWQIYCVDHAYQRGIDARDGRLVWVDGFGDAGGRPTRP
jgi:hypothetical protein